MEEKLACLDCFGGIATHLTAVQPQGDFAVAVFTVILRLHLQPELGCFCVADMALVDHKLIDVRVLDTAAAIDPDGNK